MQLRQRLYIYKKYIANIFQIEKQAKNYTTKEKYYKYKNIPRNRERRDGKYIYNIFNKSAKLVLDYKNFEKEKKD